MDRARVFLVAGTIAIAWAVFAVALSGVLHAPEIGEDRARSTATARVDGTVLAEHYAEEAGRWVYTFDIRPRSDASRVIFVAVDADRGTLVSIRSGSEVARNGE